MIYILASQLLVDVTGGVASGACWMGCYCRAPLKVSIIIVGRQYISAH